MSPLEQRTIMRYFDGELSDAEAAEVEERLRTDRQAARLLEDLSRLSGRVQEAALARAASHDDLADRVMLRLEEEGRAEPKPARKQPSAVPARVAGAIGLAVALAAAAAVMVLVRSPKQPALPDSGAAVSVPAPPESPIGPLAVADEPVDERAEGPAAIETVDFGSHAGSIFLVSEDEETTPVVWLVDEPASTLGRMDPL
jgi:anti-sigma factor RsiW